MSHVDALDRQRRCRDVARSVQTGSSSAPPMMSAFETELSKAYAASSSSRLRLGLVQDDGSPALAFAERAWRRATARTFFGRSIAWLRGLGPGFAATASGTDLSPCRALPVPFAGKPSASHVDLGWSWHGACRHPLQQLIAHHALQDVQARLSPKYHRARQCPPNSRPASSRWPA